MLTDTDYQKALGVILGNEGSGYNASDPGGGSKYGVLQSTYTAWLKKNGMDATKNIQSITLPEVVNLYRSEYWAASGAPALPYGLAVVHFDAAVNMGVGTAKKILAAAGGAGASVADYVAARQQEYRDIVARKPSLAGNLDAWLRRAGSFATSGAGQAIGGGLAVFLLVVWLASRHR